MGFRRRPRRRCFGFIMRRTRTPPVRRRLRPPERRRRRTGAVEARRARRRARRFLPLRLRGFNRSSSAIFNTSISEGVTSAQDKQLLAGMAYSQRGAGIALERVVIAFRDAIADGGVIHTVQGTDRQGDFG